jgi:hypothetical protein
MPLFSTTPSKPLSRPTARLAALTLVVLLGHAALLHGAPLVASFGAAGAAKEFRPFNTRTITLAPPTAAALHGQVAAVQVAAAAPQRPRPLSGRPTSRPAQTQDFEKDVALAPVDTAQTATENRAYAEPTTAAPVLLAVASTAPTGAIATANAPPSGVPVGAAAHRIAIPGSIHLKYSIKGEVKGFPYSASGDLRWLQDGKTYDARLEISVFLLGSKINTSKGELVPQGLAPTRFGDKYRSEVAAHFERSKGKVSFSANTPDAPLQPGAQDQLSIFLQLASMVGGDPDQFPPGTKLSFQAVGARYSDQWTFVVGTADTLDLPGGTIKAIRLTREPTSEFDTKGEVWLAPELEFLPVRIRLSQANGDFIDQLWKSTEKL